MALVKILHLPNSEVELIHLGVIGKVVSIKITTAEIWYTVYYWDAGTPRQVEVQADGLRSLSAMDTIREDLNDTCF